MSKPVLYIPGLPSSHIKHEPPNGNRERLFLNIGRLLPSPDARTLRLLRGPEDLVAPDPVKAGKPIRRLAKFLFFDLAKQAESLYEILKRIDAEVFPFGWDWRRPIWDPALMSSLRQRIEELHRLHGKITVVAHSTGGLVLRHLAESSPPDFIQKIERAITFGVPWAGTLRHVGFLAGQRSFLSLSREQAQALLAHSWAAFDLLPPDPQKTDMKRENGQDLGLTVKNGQQASLITEQGWFPPESRDAMRLRAQSSDQKTGTRKHHFELTDPSSLEIINVVGWGAKTITQAKLENVAGNQRVELTESTGDSDLTGGDETVPAVSAAWLRGGDISTYQVPVGVDPRAKENPHSTLWRTQGGRNLLRHFVGGKRLEAFAYGTVDAKDFQPGSPSVRIRLVALDQHGKALPEARVQTRNLHASSQITEDFDTSFDGRHLLRVPRSSIRTVHGDRFRRLEIEIRWRNGRQRRTLVIKA